MPVIYELLEHEGLCLGGSTGINVAGAIRLARQLGPGQTIVTMLCDSGNRYQSKLFNPEFMRSKNLPVPEWLEKRTQDRGAVREGVSANPSAVSEASWRCAHQSLWIRSLRSATLRMNSPQDLAEEQLRPRVLRIGEEILPACWPR